MGEAPAAGEVPGTDGHAQFPHLFTPLRLRNITLKSRVVLLPMGIGGGSPIGAPLEDEISFYERRAAGGVGLVITGGTVVHDTSTLRSNSVLDAFRRENIPAFKELVDRVHAHDVPIVGQLMHRGTESLGGSIFPTWAPSAVANSAGEVPHAMSRAEIRETVDSFAASAANLIEAGYDGIEIHGAHGFLVAQFLSPRSNQRTDEYGGSLENRMRFGLEVLDAIRARCGESIVVGFRLSGEEEIEDGLHLAESTVVAKTLGETGAVDYLSVSIGSGSSYVRDMSQPTGLAVRYSAALREVAGIPVVASQRITHPPLAEEILRSGAADLVGVARALMADPDWVKKARDGRLDEILPCVGCVQVCRPPLGGAGCLHNPVSGHEWEYPVEIGRAARSRRVVIVGGGPAGLETARIAAERGHRVVLFERGKRVGGQVLLAAGAPNRGELDGVVSFRESELARLGVDVRLNTEATVESVLAEQPDAIVVATGAAPVPATDLIGYDPAHVVTDWDVLTPQGVPTELIGEARSAVVVDESDGFWESASAAEALAEAGLKVQIVTGAPQVGRSIPFDSIGGLYVRLRRRNVVFNTMTAVASVEPGKVNVYDPVWMAAHHELDDHPIPADLVVVSRPRRAVDDLVDALRATGIEIHTAGDCIAPRRITEAIVEGHRIGRLL
ncbi:MAG: NADH:flavin oxidoreductase [Actinomycetia bacterium]|nr:NADH:flavin oxidoreductase [Actinomycetes bacterium]